MSDKTLPPEALLPAMRAALMEEYEADPVITACQGPPRCDLMDDAAVAAMEAGCPFCVRITVHKDGSETRSEPSEA